MILELPDLVLPGKGEKYPVLAMTVDRQLPGYMLLGYYPDVTAALDAAHGRPAILYVA